MNKLRAELCEDSEYIHKKVAASDNLHDDRMKKVKNKDEFTKLLDMQKQFEYNID